MGGLLIRYDEIICSCAVRCCGILQANKMLPGSGTKNIAHCRITCGKTHRAA